MGVPGDYTLLLEWLGLVSILTFIGSLIAIPVSYTHLTLPTNREV